MSIKRTTLFSFAFALLLASALPLVVLSKQVPALEIRAVPRQLSAGKIFPGHAMGQVFRYPAQSLSRIDVLLVKQPALAGAELTLTLREDGPRGQVLHTVQNSPASTEPGAQFVTFELPPIVNAAGSTFHFSIEASDATQVSEWAPWISWRGRSGAALPWGDRTVVPSEAVIEVKALRDDLSAVALAVDGLNVPAGTCELEVREASHDTLLRTGLLHHSSPIAGGYAVFSFDPIEDSRWREFEYRFTLPKDARPVAGEQGLSTISLHGMAPETDSVMGMTLGGQVLPHRDLIFKASGESRALARLTLLFGRANWARFLAAWLFSWIAGGWVLALFLGRTESAQDSCVPH